MAISVSDIFKIGIEPSSSHTVGPMRAALTFANGLKTSGRLDQLVSVKSELFASLGATGKGHDSPKAIILGLEGHAPETVDVDSISARVAKVRASNSLDVLGEKTIECIDKRDLLLHRGETLPYHANGMEFTAFGSEEEIRAELLHIWHVMDNCIERGFQTEGILPGGLKVKRRSNHLHCQLTSQDTALNQDPLIGYGASSWLHL